MDFSTWKFFKPFQRGNGFRLFLNIFMSLLQAIVLFPAVLLIRGVFDEAIPQKNVQQLIFSCMAILLLYVLNGALTLATRYLSLSATKMIVMRIQDEIVKKIYSLPRTFFSKADRMRLHTRMVQDTLRVDIMFNALLAVAFPDFLIGIGLVAILLYLDIRLFLTTMLISPLLVVFNFHAGKKLREKINLYHRCFELFSRRVLTLLNTIDLTRIQSCEDREMSEQKKVHDELRRTSGAQAWWNAAYKIVQKITIVSMGTIILIVGGALVLADHMTLGELFSFFAATGFLRNCLLSMTEVIPNIVEGNESLKVLHEILTDSSSLPYHGKKKVGFAGTISFQDVDFSYGSRHVLRQISFDLLPHQVACIYGLNGSGKSTIVNLVLGFYRPDRGRLFADGQPYENLDLVNLRRYFGVVQQDPTIFPGTILENITYGCSGFSEEKLQPALHLALCEEFIDRLPEGLNTLLGEKGHILSGGEIQRIAIARALIGNHPLLILDEPGNHLDFQSIKKIVCNIRNLAHRPAVVLFGLSKPFANLADAIWQLRDGKMIRREKGRMV